MADSDTDGRVARLTSIGDVAREENEPVILCVVHGVAAGGTRATDRRGRPAKNPPVSLALVKTVASLLEDDKYG